MPFLLALTRVKGIGCIVLVGLVFVVSVTIVGLVSIKGTFADDDVAIKAAAHAKYSNARVVETSSTFVRFFGCKKGDSVRYTVEATMKGALTRFYVCYGSVNGARIVPIN